jgi:hypothetical protein
MDVLLMRPTDERENILKSMEKHNVELTRAFEKHREIKNIQCPKIDEDGEISPEDQNIIVEIYYNHRKSLHDILECASNLKKDIEDIENYFTETEEPKILGNIFLK